MSDKLIVKVCLWCHDVEAVKRSFDLSDCVIHETICDTHLREQEQLGHITNSLLEPVDLMD